MAEIHVVATGLRFPEGPVAMPDGGFLVVEIERRTLSRISRGGEVTVVAETGGSPNGLAIGKDGAAYVCNSGGFEFLEDQQGLWPVAQAHDYSHGRLERVDLATGSVRCMTRGIPDRALRGPNDLVVDRLGGIWFTDLGNWRPRDLDYGGVYRHSWHCRSPGRHFHPSSLQ